MHKIDSNPAPKNWTLYYKNSLAYDGERGIYTITDSNGKSQTTIVTDER